MRTCPCSVITVTHDSQRYIDKAMACVAAQTLPPEKVILVDSGSKDLAYLSRWKQEGVSVMSGGDEIGFCRANNIGMKEVAAGSDTILFLNPDAFLTPTFLEQAMEFLDRPENRDVGVVTGSLLGYDIVADRPTGRYDSTGIFLSWFGKWYDRDQGVSEERVSHDVVESPQAICGALMLCRRQALQEVLLRGDEVFDSTFYMYKEDIDLSLRLRRRGWRLCYLPWLKAYHCRGWQADRSKMARRFRLCSARNEMRIHARSKSPALFVSALKYAAVALLDV